MNDFHVYIAWMVFLVIDLIVTWDCPESVRNISCFIGLIVIYFIFWIIASKREKKQAQEEEEARIRQEQERQEKLKKERQEKLKKERQEKLKKERRARVLQLIKLYPEATKHYLEHDWGIKKSQITESDITDRKVETLLSHEKQYEADELLYNEAYRKKKEEEKEKMMKRIENARRREQERLEQERLEQERLEQERLEQKRQEAERKRREQELQRQREAERQKREISELKDCTASWFRSNRSTVPYFPLYYYYPTTCGWDVDEDDWTVRNLIWDFKANPNRPQSDAEIKRRHETSASCVLPDFEKLLRKTFGGKISQLTLVCIPSSKRVVYERRCRDFSSSLCSRLGLANGYNYVSVVADGEAKHISGASTAEFSVDGNFFRGRKVLLFDDVLTTGASMEKFKRLLEGVGATVIAGICIGVTTHSPQFGEPKNRI